MDIPVIAEKIATSILAGCDPGEIPPFELTLRCFTDAYEQLGKMPSDDEHWRIAGRVGALIF